MKLVRVICSSILLVASLLAVFQPAAVLAQEQTTPAPEEITITAKYPKVEVTSGEKAVFELELKYGGEITGNPKVFDLTVSGPKDWEVNITPKYPTDRKISSIQLLPGFQVGEQILVNATPAYWLRPNPGNYTVTLEAISQDGKLRTKYEMTTVVTAKYYIVLTPAAERYNTVATAGKDNFFSINVVNTGSASVSQIQLSADKPEEWLVKFEPQKVDSLGATDTQTVDVNIKPPARTIAGDYLITIKATGTQATAEDLQIRVTVETPTIWGWVGIAIVIVVVAGLVLTFRQLSRR